MWGTAMELGGFGLTILMCILMCVGGFVMYGSDQPAYNSMGMSLGPNEKVLHSLEAHNQFNFNWKQYIWFAPILIMILGLAMYGLRKIVQEMIKPKNRRAVIIKTSNN